MQFFDLLSNQLELIDDLKIDTNFSKVLYVGQNKNRFFLVGLRTNDYLEIDEIAITIHLNKLTGDC